MIVPKIIPDTEIVQAVAKYWPEPYRVRVMTTIILMESGGNAHALNLNLDGLFANTLDRGLGQINEVAIEQVLGYSPDPTLYVGTDSNVSMMKATWDWRFQVAQKEKGLGYGAALVWAYEGWTAYKHRASTDLMKQRWSMFWQRAGDAMTSLGMPLQ